MSNGSGARCVLHAPRPPSAPRSMLLCTSACARMHAHAGARPLHNPPAPHSPTTTPVLEACMRAHASCVCVCVCLALCSPSAASPRLASEAESRAGGRPSPPYGPCAVRMPGQRTGARGIIGVWTNSEPAVLSAKRIVHASCCCTSDCITCASRAFVIGEAATLRHIAPPGYLDRWFGFEGSQGEAQG